MKRRRVISFFPGDIEEKKKRLNLHITFFNHRSTPVASNVCKLEGGKIGEEADPSVSRRAQACQLITTPTSDGTTAARGHEYSSPFS